MTPERPSKRFLPLPAAAAIAHARLARGRRQVIADNVLDAVATALAVVLPLYAGQPPRRLSDEELALGRFRRGATVLQRADGTIVCDALRVERGELERAIGELARAGVSFSEVRCELAPRRLPTVMPA